MTKQKEIKKDEVKKTKEAPLRGFFFPDVHNGMTIRAKNREEAEQKAEAIRNGLSESGNNSSTK